MSPVSTHSSVTWNNDTYFSAAVRTKWEKTQCLACAFPRVDGKKMYFLIFVINKYLFNSQIYRRCWKTQACKEVVLWTQNSEYHSEISSFLTNKQKGLYPALQPKPLHLLLVSGSFIKSLGQHTGLRSIGFSNLFTIILTFDRHDTQGEGGKVSGGPTKQMWACIPITQRCRIQGNSITEVKWWL